MGSGADIDDLDVNWLHTGFSCSTCGEEIDFHQEVFCISIVFVQWTDRGVTYAPVLFEDGDFLYAPHFFCCECTDENSRELKDHRRDRPPIEDQYTIADCSICKSGIRHGEVAALITHGEIQLSKRNPNGVHGGNTFDPTDTDPDILCISCINTLSSDVVDQLWQEPVCQFRECAEGSEIRCWRGGCPADETNECAKCKVR